MSGDRWERIQALFAGAWELPAEQRAAWLARATDDPVLRAEVDSLLDSAARPGRLDQITRYLGTFGEPSSRDDPLPRLRAALAERYEIERELARGGMAILYLAQDLKHHRRVALKLLRPEFAPHLGARRFLREIDTTARLTHPHILPLHDSGEAGDLLYYVMPYVEGESLHQRLHRTPRLSPGEAVAIAREVADALSYAHGLGVVHRDIKPGNILLAAGHAVVADFGIARALDAAAGDRITESGMTLGTPAYMSPEQAGVGDAIDARTDIYSLGCVVYEMLAGQPPFTGTRVLARLVLDPVPPLRTFRPEIPPGLEDVIARALAKAPADRYATPREFADALEQALLAPPIPAPPARSRSRRRILLGALVAVVLAGSWWLSCAQWSPADRPVSLVAPP